MRIVLMCCYFVHLQVCGVAFSQGGTHFASCSREGSLAVFSMETMEQIVLLQAPKKVDVSRVELSVSLYCFVRLSTFKLTASLHFSTLD